MTIIRHLLKQRVLAPAIGLAAMAGCLGMPSIHNRSLPLKTTGNVVVSCYNSTDKPAVWRIALLSKNGQLETVQTLDSKPGEMESISVEAPMAKIGVGGFEAGGVGVIINAGAPDEARVVYDAPALARTRDFTDGDVIALTLADAGSGQYRITAEVVPGG